MAKKKPPKMGKTREVWEEKHAGAVHKSWILDPIVSADKAVARKFDVKPHTVRIWRSEWRKDGWKQPTRSDVPGKKQKVQSIR